MEIELRVVLRWLFHHTYAIFLCHYTLCYDVKPQRENYVPDYGYYHNVSRIMSHLQEIARQHPSYVHLDMSYHSRRGNPQPVMRITNFTSMSADSPFYDMPSRRATLLLSYGEHAREFLPVESMFFLIQNLTSGLYPNADPYAKKFSKFVVEYMDIFLIAMVNPDGRLHIENNGNFCWRGTSTGVDLNRNFDWNFGGSKGSSLDPDDEEYRGEHPFSEPECTVLLDLTAKYKFDAFVSLHSGIRHIYVPFADSASKKSGLKPANVEQMLDLAARMAGGVAGGKRFTYGVAYTLSDYTADGTVFDFMAGNRKIPFSFAIELWGSGNSARAKCFDLFNPKSQHLGYSLLEHFPIYETLLLYLVEYKQGRYSGHVMEDPYSSLPSMSFAYSLLALVVLLTLAAAAYNNILPCVRPYQRRRVVSLRSLSSAFSMASFIKVS